MLQRNPLGSPFPGSWPLATKYPPVLVEGELCPTRVFKDSRLASTARGPLGARVELGHGEFAVAERLRRGHSPVERSAQVVHEEIPSLGQCQLPREKAADVYVYVLGHSLNRLRVGRDLYDRYYRVADHVALWGTGARQPRQQPLR